MSSCDDLRLSLGSYAIGNLDPEDAARVEHHLRGCAACRRAHADLAPLPALLHLVDPGATRAEPPSAHLEASVLAGFAAQRPSPTEANPTPARRRPWKTSPARWRIAVTSGLAGAAATVAVLAVVGVFSGPPTGGSQIELTAPGGDGVARAEVQLATTGTGTEVGLQAELPELRDGEVYELWFVRGTGRVSAGTFRVDGEGRARVRLAAAADADAYDRIGITREPDGLDPARNGPTVVVGRLDRTRSRGRA